MPKSVGFKEILGKKKLGPKKFLSKISGHFDKWFPKIPTGFYSFHRLMCWRACILNICKNTLKIKD